MKGFHLMNSWLGAILLQASRAGKLRSRCSVLVVAVLAASFVFSTGAVNAQALPSVAQTEAQLDLLSLLNPQAYEAAIAAIEEHGVDTETGIDLSRVPESIVSTLDPVIWATLIDHARATDRYLSGTDSDVKKVESRLMTRRSPAIIGPIWAFIRANWSRIVAAAKASGKWVWYKANRCAHGAFTGLVDTANLLALQPVDFLVSQPKTAAAAAGYGCIKAL